VLIAPVSAAIFEVSPLILDEVSELIELEEPELIVVVSVVIEVESVVESEPPLPQAVKAPNTNTNNSFFIVSLFIVNVDFRVNAGK